MESPEETKLINEIVSRLDANWPCSDERNRYKRRDIANWVKEVGMYRAKHAVKRVLQEYTETYPPPVATLRSYMPSMPTSREQRWEEEKKILAVERAKHPENFYGIADVTALIQFGLDKMARGEREFDFQRDFDPLIQEARKRFGRK